MSNGADLGMLRNMDRPVRTMLEENIFISPSIQNGKSFKIEFKNQNLKFWKLKIVKVKCYVISK
jgi:hypothetical protein